MANRRRAVEEAVGRWRRALPELIAELREARLLLGLTQREVASSLGVSRDHVGRFERLRVANLDVDYLIRHAAVLGLKASIKLYPMGGAIRDEAQARYIARFVERIGHAWRVLLDAPIPLPGDLRGIDVLLEGAGVRIAVEVITRLRDLQAQIRAAQLKQRDVGAGRLIIVIAGSHGNRRALVEARATLLATFELDTRRVMACLSRGEDTGRDAVIVID